LAVDVSYIRSDGDGSDFRDFSYAVPPPTGKAGLPPRDPTG
jgi:hypothetical protein